jgi:hypothetical protein
MLGNQAKPDPVENSTPILTPTLMAKNSFSNRPKKIEVVYYLTWTSSPVDKQEKND